MDGCRRNKAMRENAEPSFSFIRFLIMGTRVLLGSVCFSSLFLVVFNILIFLNKSAFLPLEAKRGRFLF